MSADHSPNDPLIALQARVDQVAAEAPLWAQLAKAYVEALLEAGFSEAAALYLTASQLHSNPGRPG